MTHSSPTRRTSDLCCGADHDDYARLYRSQQQILNRLRHPMNFIDEKSGSFAGFSKHLGFCKDRLQLRHIGRDSGDRFEAERSEEHTSELQSLMRISYAVFCLKTNKNNTSQHVTHSTT